MKLNEIFDQLAYGELAHLFIKPGVIPADGIPTDKRKSVFLSVQLGLVEIYKRFLIREGELTIGLTEGKVSYQLIPRFAASNIRSTETNKYILDSDNPFRDDLLKIERVYNAEGTELPLNIFDDVKSVRTLSFNSLLIPSDLKGDTLKVVYRANHPVLQESLAIAAPSVVEIELPITHMTALLLWIASRVHTKPGMIEQFHDGNNYMSKFEAECIRLQDSGFNVDSSSSNNRLKDKGWV